MIPRSYKERLQQDVQNTTQDIYTAFYYRQKKLSRPEAGKPFIRTRAEQWLDLDEKTHGEYQSPRERRELIRELGSFCTQFGPPELASALAQRLREIPEHDISGPQIIGGHDS